ncbi:MAG: TRAP transporter fused permease subunit [Dehalococcoidia bacterium]|nr:TRAP transporter fused permease subunit [Dehalococcoidia bacterium]
MEKLDNAQVEKIVEKVETRLRQFHGPMRVVISAISILLVGYLLAYILGFLTGQKIFLYLPQFRAMGLALIFILAYLLAPFRRQSPRDKVPWYDFLFMLMGVVPCLYFFFVYPGRVGMMKLEGPHEVVLAIFLLISLTEATRRLMGIAVTTILLVFIAYPMLSAYAPGFLHGRGLTPTDAISRFFLFESTGIFGSFLELALGIFFMFLLFAAFLQVTGAGDFFMNLALSLMGHVRGGPAKVVIVGDTFLGTMTGSAVANVVASGVITIPLMIKTGYKRHFAAAVEAVSSTGGQLVPPVMGVTAFLMAEVLNISYWQIAVAAIIPSVLYYLALYFMIDFEAAKNNLAGRPRAELPHFWKVLGQGWFLFVPLGLLIYFLGKLAYSPEKAALYATVALILLSFVRKETRLTLRKLLTAIESTAGSMLEVTIMTGAVAIIAGSVAVTGMGVNLSGGLVDLSGGNVLILLLLTAVTCYILGMGLPTMAAYLLLALLVAPALVKGGISPFVAHFFIFYWSLTSHITPPVAPAAFVAAGLAGASMWKTCWTSMRLGLILLILPFFFVYNPALLMQGSALSIVEATFTAIIGTIVLASALQGYLFDYTKLWQRVSMGIGGLLLIFPDWKTEVVGIALVIPTVLLHWSSVRAHKAEKLATTKLSNPQDL